MPFDRLYILYYAAQLNTFIYHIIKILVVQQSLIIISNLIMEQSLQEVSNLLQNTFTQASSEKILEAENKLYALSKEACFMQVLAQIITSADSSKPLKQAAVSYVKTFINGVHMNEMQDNEAKQSNISQIYLLLQHPSLDNRHKYNLVNPLVMLLQSDFQGSLKLKMLASIEESLMSGQATLLLGNLFAMQGLAQAVVKPKEAEGCFQRCYALLSQKMAVAAQAYRAGQERENHLDVIEQSVRVVHIFIKKFKTQANKQLNSMVNNENFVQLFVDVVTKLEEGWGKDEATRRVQRLANEVLDTLVEHLVERDVEEVQKSKLLPLSLQVMDHILGLMVQLSQGDYLSAMTQEQEGDQLIVSFLSLVSKTAQCNSYYEWFSRQKNSLFFQVVVPLLQFDPQEEALLEDNPEQLVKLSMDCVDKQKIRCAKTSAAALLEEMCDHIDGAPSIFCQATIQMLQFSLGAASPSASPILNDSLVTKLLQQPPTVLLDASLMVLSIMSYILHQRKDLIQLLQSCLEENYAALTSNTQHPIVRVRVCMLISYYYDNLFESQKDLQQFKGLIQYLVSQVNENQQATNTEKAIAYMAVESLKGIFEFNEPKQQLLGMVNECLRLLVNNIDKPLHQSYYDILFNVIEHYDETVGDDVSLVQLVLSQLVNKVQSQLADPNRKDQLIINKCWNILRLMASKENLVCRHALLFENETRCLLQYIKEPQNIDFDEDIMDFMLQMLKNTQTVTPLMVDLVVVAARPLAVKYKSLCFQFELVNYVVEYAQALSEQVVQLLLEVALEVMTVSSHSEGDKATAALLIQLVVHRHPLSQQQVNVIVQQTHGQLSAQIENQFYRNSLVAVLNSLLVSHYDNTLAVLSALALKDTIFQTMLSPTLDYGLLYQDKYYRSVYILALIAIANHLEHHAGHHNHIMLALINIIDYHVNSDNRPKNPNCQLEEEEEEEDEDEEDEEEDDYGFEFEDDDMGMFMSEKGQKEVQQRIASMKSRMKAVDIFQEFKAMFARLKGEQHQLLMSIINSLDSSDQHKLKDILYSQQIQVNNTVVSRKIYKIKPKQK